jgi:hypothetical protein
MHERRLVFVSNKLVEEASNERVSHGICEFLNVSCDLTTRIEL